MLFEGSVDGREPVTIVLSIPDGFQCVAPTAATRIPVTDDGVLQVSVEIQPTKLP